jgi:hypothetical protein
MALLFQWFTNLQKFRDTAKTKTCRWDEKAEAKPTVSKTVGSGTRLE